MGRYKKITRKKGAEDDLLSMEPESAMEWLSQNAGKLAAIITITAISIASFFGYAHYNKVSFQDAHLRLFSATSLAPAESANKSQGKAAIEALSKMTEKKENGKVQALAYLEMASLQSRLGNYDDAAATYDKLATISEKGTLAYELALAGSANALIRSGKAEMASQPLKELAETATNYPRSDALYTMAFAYAASGEKDSAIGALNKIKSDYPAFLAADFIDDLIRRIDADELEKAFIDSITPKEASASPNTPSPSGGKIGVHTGTKGE